jgi:hypothetical protein
VKPGLALHWRHDMTQLFCWTVNRQVGKGDGPFVYYFTGLFVFGFAIGVLSMRARGAV